MVGRSPCNTIHSTMADEHGAQQACNSTSPTPSGISIAGFFMCVLRQMVFTLYSPLAFHIRSLAALISWNFFSAALRTSSPRAATLSGWCSSASRR